MERESKYCGNSTALDWLRSWDLACSSFYTARAKKTARMEAATVTIVEDCRRFAKLAMASVIDSTHNIIILHV